MHAKQGDQIVIDTTTLDALRRRGEVIEVIGQGEREHYRIRLMCPAVSCARIRTRSASSQSLTHTVRVA